MRWVSVTIFLRLICLISGIGSLGVAWHLTRIGSSGIEDVPPPLMQKIRYLDKLIDELAKGKAMEKILRQ
jgi:hypothetical protein